MSPRPDFTTRPQFTLRALFVLTAVVGVLLAVGLRWPPAAGVASTSIMGFLLCIAGSRRLDVPGETPATRRWLVVTALGYLLVLLAPWTWLLWDNPALRGWEFLMVPAVLVRVILDMGLPSAILLSAALVGSPVGMGTWISRHAPRCAPYLASGLFVLSTVDLLLTIDCLRCC